MKTVFKKDEVAHIWANQLQQSGRNSDGNFYFEGDTIYSYGGHFPIAKHVENKNGQKAVLFTFRGYSNTTAKQIGITRRAVSNKDVIICHTPSLLHSLNMSEYLKAIKNELHGLNKAKKLEKYINPAKEMYNNAIKYAEFFGIDIPKEMHDIINSATNGEYKIYLQNEATRISEERIKEEKRLLRVHNKNLSEWRQGKGERLYSRNPQRDYLRFNGKRVETSQGVEIPLQIAKNTFKWILTTIKKGGCIGECGYKVLDYSVNEVTPELVKIGCHTIDLKEINKFALLMKW